MSNIRPVFIGGTGRSGTTILKRLLVNHPDVVGLPFELRLIIDPDGAVDLFRSLTVNWSPFHSDMAIHRFEQMVRACTRRSPVLYPLSRLARKLNAAPMRYAAMHLGTMVGEARVESNFQRMKQQLIRGVSRGTFIGSPPWQLRGVIYEAGPASPSEVAAPIANFIHSLYEPLRSPNRESVWVEDTPSNPLFAEELEGLFPERGLIHIYRHPFDVISSFRTKKWGGRDIRLITERVRSFWVRWFQIRERLSRNSYLEVPLEAWAKDTDSWFSRICEYIGIEVHPSLWSIPLDRVNAGRYRQEMSATERRLATEILGDVLEQLDYKD